MNLQTKYFDVFHQGINHLRQGECFTDITIEVEGKHFQCHKLVLSAVSPYFNAMFTVNMSESKSRVVSLPLLQADIFEIILDFLYTGKNIINVDTALKLFEASDFMQIEILQKACEEFLENSVLNVDNCVDLWQVAKKISIKQLEKKVFKFILDNFSRVIKMPSFLGLDIEDIKCIFSNNCACLPGEDELSEVLLKWLEKDIEQRKTLMKDVLKLLRLPFTSGEYLFQQLYQEHSSLVSDSELSPLVEEAKKYFTLPARQSEFWTETTQQRPASLFEDVLVVIEATVKQPDKSITNSRCMAYSLDKKMWFHLRSLPDCRMSGIATCAYGQSTIYVSGGKTSVSSRMIKYDGKTNEWCEVACIPVHLITNHSMTVVSTGIYIIGGYFKFKEEQSVSSKVYCYDMSGHDLKEAGSLQHAVHTTTTAVCNGKIIIFGGFTSFPVIQGYSSVELVQCFDPRSGSTTVITGIQATLGSKSVGFDDYILIVTPHGKVLKVSFEEKSYSEVAELPHFSRGRFDVIKRKQCLFLIGGTGKDGDGNSWFKDMLCFNLETTKSPKESLPFRVGSALKIAVKKTFLKNEVKII